jgi:hypothetical protein
MQGAMTDKLLGRVKREHCLRIVTDQFPRRQVDFGAKFLDGAHGIDVSPKEISEPSIVDG